MITKRTYLRLLMGLLCAATSVHAQQSRKLKPTSKIYVADMVGDAEINLGTEIDELTKRSVYNAEGTSITTKANSNASLVFSNGTGIYFDASTLVQIKQFNQDSFRPNRADIDDEPSISTTHIFVSHGDIGISTSKLVAGSTLVVDTSLASASIRGRQSVVHVKDNLTVISMVQGEATVKAGLLDPSHLVPEGKQIIIRPGKTDEQNIVVIQNISDGKSDDERIWLDDRLVTADSSRRVVYFEVQNRTGAAAAAVGGGVTAFDGGSNAAGGTDSGGNQIIAVPVTPATPPVQPNVSPANLSGQ